MPRICDIAHIIEAQDVGGERAQAGKMPGLQRMRLASSAKLPSRT